MTIASTIEVGSQHAATPHVVNRFRELFNTLDKGNLNKLAGVYSEHIHFKDPLGEVHGLDELTRYFAGSYQNVIASHFVFDHEVVDEGTVTLPWTMHLRHKRINGGKEIQVEGISHLHIDCGKVNYHRDYFDAGQMLYENLPLLGGIIRKIKEHAG
ncbi:nuclear transport factor 2 family protein [Marinobacter sp. ELB17]|uniref:nuclear transport factor 2 family protein n=1 Tax=Marinobacter sp. ELB17 TaxID=270374 RepID=UPI0000F37021|nr:nuclear transport factor 2 family protein [Marinobacter sp. ELB17]EAZ97937.1 transcriptional regulator, putative [Marinobacter sp. ELB17]